MVSMACNSEEVVALADCPRRDYTTAGCQAGLPGHLPKNLLTRPDHWLGLVSWSFFTFLQFSWRSSLGNIKYHKSVELPCWALTIQQAKVRKVPAPHTGQAGCAGWPGAASLTEKTLPFHEHVFGANGDLPPQFVRTADICPDYDLNQSEAIERSGQNSCQGPFIVPSKSFGTRITAGRTQQKVHRSPS